MANLLFCTFLLHLTVYTGSRMTAYEFLRNKVLKRNPDGRFPLWQVSVSFFLILSSFKFLKKVTNICKTNINMLFEITEKDNI